MRSFKNIAIIIIMGVSILFIFNIFYLRGLFISIEGETKREVSFCMEEADSKEMQDRLDTISRFSSESHSIEINKAFSSDSLKGPLQTTTTHSMINNKDTATEVHSEANSLNITALNSLLLKEIRSVIHQNIDLIIPINLHKLNSLLNRELVNKGIQSEVFYIEIIDQTSGNILSSSYNEEFEYNTGYSFSYLFDMENNYAYQIHMSSLASAVFRQMAGILVSTFLIIILLGMAFWFFIHTVTRQKTLEEMKDDFTNNMTHELKTPIAVAYSAADTLLNFRQGENKEKRKKYLQVCIDQLGHLSGLVEQILSMSMERRKSMTFHKEYVEIKNVISQQAELHQFKTNKEVIFDIRIDPEDMTILADNVHLNNIISNLLENAIKYSVNKAIIEISAWQEENYSILVIKDHGVGVASHHLEHIFDKFYRVPNGNLHNVKGYGLGLFYVKQIVEKHNGLIQVKSILNKGTAFTIKLPIE